MGFSAYFLFFNAERVFAILFSYLKEPQLIIASFIPDRIVLDINTRILDIETLEGHFQKERETPSPVHMFSLHLSLCSYG